jgi:hypothetical protein
MNASLGRSDPASAPDAPTPDRRQADYYRLLLAERCAQTDRRIAEYRTMLSRDEARGYLDEVRRIRRLIRIEERERETLDRMLKALHRRFPRSAREWPRRRTAVRRRRPSR